MADSDKQEGKALSDGELQDLVASTDTGARNVVGPVGIALAGVALAWSLFQLWIASPLPFIAGSYVSGIVLNNTETRSIHLALAVFLTFMSYPALARSTRDRVPILDWVLALAGAF